MELLIGLCLMFAAVFILPLLLLKVFVHLLVGLLVLPFKLAGGVIKLLAGIVGLGAKLLFGGLGLLAFLLGLVVFVIALPLLPFLVLAGIVWLLVQAATPVVPVPRP